MQVILADVFGFCIGVRRAVSLAEDAAQEGPIETLGQLIHNQQELTRLETSGVRAVDSTDELQRGTVVIRAHGATPATFVELRRRGLKIVDATCPFVTKSQRIATRLDQAGYDVVIVGEAEHPEIKGVRGYCQGRFFVIRSLAELEQLPADLRPGLLAQTTTDEEKFLAIAAALAVRFPAARVYNTVCSATHERQLAARKLAEDVDACYVIGGRHSANTIKLAEIARTYCKKVFLIENADEIDCTALSDCEKVGVTAGASTPDWIIDDVLARLRAISLQKESNKSREKRPA